MKQVGGRIILEVLERVANLDNAGRLKAIHINPIFQKILNCVLVSKVKSRNKCILDLQFHELDIEKVIIAYLLYCFLS